MAQYDIVMTVNQHREMAVRECVDQVRIRGDRGWVAQGGASITIDSFPKMYIVIQAIVKETK